MICGNPALAMQGFIQRGRGGGWAWNSPPPPLRSVEIEYGYYCSTINISYLILYVTGRKYVSSKYCLESLSQITSEAI